MTITTIEPDIIELPEPEPDEPYDPDEHEYPDIQPYPTPDWTA